MESYKVVSAKMITVWVDDSGGRELRNIENYLRSLVLTVKALFYKFHLRVKCILYTLNFCHFFPFLGTENTWNSKKTKAPPHDIHSLNSGICYRESTYFRGLSIFLEEAHTPIPFLLTPTTDICKDSRIRSSATCLGIPYESMIFSFLTLNSLVGRHCSQM